MLGFVRSLNRYSEIGGLLLGELGELGTNFGEMESGNLLVEVLG